MSGGQGGRRGGRERILSNGAPGFGARAGTIHSRRSSTCYRPDNRELSTCYGICSGRVPAQPFFSQAPETKRFRATARGPRARFRLFFSPYQEKSPVNTHRQMTLPASVGSIWQNFETGRRVSESPYAPSGSTPAAARKASAVSRTPASSGVTSDQKLVANFVASTK